MVKESASENVMAKGRTAASHSQTEILLWNEFRQGSLDAYAIIYQKYFFTLYGYGLKVCSDKNVVKDCVQELFVQIWKSKENLKETNSIKYYLLTAIKRKLIDHFAAQARFSSITDLEGLEEWESTASEESHIIMEQHLDEQKQVIIASLDKLTKRQKEAVILKFYNNMPSEDIALRMNISVEGVYNLVSKALSRCRKEITKAYYTLL